MKSFVIAVCVFACVYATSNDQAAQVLTNVYNLTPDGDFAYSYETDNGISGQATGGYKNVGKDELALEVKGVNSFKSPEGDIFTITFTADENGYRAEGAHLPTPPAPEPIPEYIQRSLDYIAAHPYTEKN